MLRTAGLLAALIAGTLFVAEGPALAAEPSTAGIPKMKIRVVGDFHTLFQVKLVEKPFWTEQIPKDSGGKISVEYNAYDLLGLKEQQLIRLTDSGVADFATTDISKIAGDDPVFEGCDLAGITSTVKAARAGCKAWFPVVAKAMAEKFNTKLLGLAPNPGIVFWCRNKITGLADLKGKKVRVFNRTLADFVTALGGQTVTTPFGAVPSALQRGVFDCALTATLAGNSAGWPEVSKYLLPLPVGWSIYYQSANLKTWNSFNAATKAFFLKEFAKLDDELWNIGARMYNEGINCNIGKEPCKLGHLAHMTLVPVTKKDEELRRKLVQNVVLPDWAKRCGKQCAETWNKTVGKAVGLQIPKDKL